MIESGFSYIATILVIAGIIVQLERKYNAFFKHVPGIVILYFLIMLCSTLGFWKKSPEIDKYYEHLKDNLLPSMIFLMLLRCDLRKILRLGTRMLLGFFSATVTICIGFIVSFWLMKNWFATEPEAWKTFASLCGSWIGGTGNMTAIQAALKVSENQMGYALIMDSVNYGIWVMILLAIVPFAQQFNAFVKAETNIIEKIGTKLMEQPKDSDREVNFPDLIFILGISFAISAFSKYIAGFCPKSDFFSTYTWTVLIATIFGIVGAITYLGKMPGIPILSNFTLYLIVALVASKANFSGLSKAPWYILAGFIILIIHGVLMIIVAKILHLDLFTCGVASLANIGGIASAPILAAAYSEALIPVGVLMAMMGYVIGTGCGLFVGKILSTMVII